MKNSVSYVRLCDITVLTQWIEDGIKYFETVKELNPSNHIFDGALFAYRRVLNKVNDLYFSVDNKR